MDPLGIGNNSTMLDYFNSFPEPNDLAQGDLLNFVGYRFRGPIPTSNNWYIARADFKINKSGSHSLFWRGALRNDARSSDPYLPGKPPLHTFTDFSKGYVIGYTALLKSNVVNNFHWGFTRQSIGDIGNDDTQPFIYFRGLNDDEGPNNSELAVTRSRVYQAPVYNFVDDLSWTKGKHTLQFGTNIRFIRNPRSNFLNSFSSGTTNSSGLDSAGVANTFSPLDPKNFNCGGGTKCLPAVDRAFRIGYNYPIMAMMGIVSELDATFNFDKTGTALPQGAPLKRRFGADEYEFYMQDSYRARPNLTINYGVRYSLFSPPWETNGVQVAPTVSLGDWFQQRATKMLTGGSSATDPLLTYNLAGPANHKQGYYNWDFHNFGPHVSFAYSPQSKTVIRGGFGMVFDHIGSGLLDTFDQRGSFGLSTQITAPVPSATTAPRLTGLNSLPTVDATGAPYFPATPTGGFPYTYPPAFTSLAIQWGLDDKIRTPYAYTIDFSIGRELPRNMSLQVSYVGRMSHRLLTQEDLAMPLNIVDPKSKISYLTAARRLSELGFAGTPTSDVTPALVGPTAAYWQNMVAPLNAGDQYNLACAGPYYDTNPQYTTDPVQAMYDLFACGGGPVGAGFGDETTPLANLDYWGSDFSGIPGIAGMLADSSGNPVNYYPSSLGPNAFFNSQFHSLYAWRSVGNSNYNALQVNLRKRMSQGIQFDFNYTYSKSIDLSSDAERIDAWSGLGGQVINSWSPGDLRAVSDFDAAHQINANWVVELPFGKGKPLAGSVGGVGQAFIGGWELSGLARWTSGFPVSMSNGATWPTNWQLGGAATTIGPVHAHTTIRSDGSVNLFPTDLPQLPLGLGLGPFRHDLPGESGTRNNVRGPGYAGLDMALSKRWKMPYGESHNLLFRWEVFNVPNLKRFDVQTITTDISSAAFGVYSGLLTSPRVMQFALRYEF
jgi:hypothetical protein